MYTLSSSCFYELRYLHTPICINFISDSINLGNRFGYHLPPPKSNASRCMSLSVTESPRRNATGGGSSIMTMRIIFQKSHSSFRKTNGHESRIRFGLDSNRWYSRFQSTFIRRVRKGYNQFFEEEEEEETSRLSLATMGSREINRRFSRKTYGRAISAHGSAAYNNTVHPVPS